MPSSKTHPLSCGRSNIAALVRDQSVYQKTLEMPKEKRKSKSNGYEKQYRAISSGSDSSDCGNDCSRFLTDCFKSRQKPRSTSNGRAKYGSTSNRSNGTVSGHTGVSQELFDLDLDSNSNARRSPRRMLEKSPSPPIHPGLPCLPEIFLRSELRKTLENSDQVGIQ